MQALTVERVMSMEACVMVALKIHNVYIDASPRLTLHETYLFHSIWP